MSIEARTRYILHYRYLDNLTLTGEKEIDSTITRLSFYSHPSLVAFFEPFVSARVEFTWKNDTKYPREAALFKKAYASVVDGSADNRDLLLFALAQIVRSNLPSVVNSLRKSVGTAFCQLMVKEEIPLSQLVYDCGGEDFLAGGVFSLCRFTEKDSQVVVTVPPVIREAMGISLAAAVPPPRKKKKVELPGSLSVLNIAPSDVDKYWGVADFVMGLSKRESVMAPDIKEFERLVDMPEIPAPSVSGAPRPVSAERIFMIVQSAVSSKLRHKQPDTAAEDLQFPQCLRSLVRCFTTGSLSFSFDMVQECAKHLAGVNNGLDYEAVNYFFSIIVSYIGNMDAGVWYETGTTLDNIVSSLADCGRSFPSMSASLYSTNLYNCYREKRNYGQAKLDVTLDLHLPFMKMALAVLALFGLVSVGLGDEPQKVGRRSQFDSVKAFAITPLGSYAFGKTADAPPFDRYVIQKCRLDEEYPFIYVPEEMYAIYTPYLKKIGMPIGPTRYAVSVQTFMKGVKKREDLNERIAGFKEFVGHELPAVWQTLLDRIVASAGSVRIGLGYFTPVQLDPENSELLEFVLHNELISESCVRGENCMLFVPVANLDVIINEFAAAGYLVK